MAGLNEKIVIHSDMAGVELVRLFLKDIALRLDLPAEPAYHLELAVTEACLNIIRYAYAQGPGEIRIWARLDAGCLTIEIRDDGRPFDPRDVEPPDLDRYVRDGIKGGFGVHLMRSLMEGLDYRREEKQNVLSLWMTIPSAPGG
jgi:anti-sigma regulatory factor (Ser/Thr protein kinase)